MSIVPRRRRTPGESRSAALTAARAILVETGPQGVTLKAVAARIGRTHATLLHHFGTAAGLHAALSESMANEIIARIAATAAAARCGEAEPGAVVDLAFDAFGRSGGASLASWALLNGEPAVLVPVLKGVHRLVDELGGVDGQPVREVALVVALTAIGDALLGEALSAELQLPRETARTLVTRMLLDFLFGTTQDK